MFFLILLAALGLWIAFLVALAATDPGRSRDGTRPLLTDHRFFTRL